MGLDSGSSGNGVELDSGTLRLGSWAVPMIALIGTGRGAAVVRVTDSNGLEYRHVNSSKTFEIGSLPSLGTVFDLKARNPRFRRPWIVVEFANGAVFSAQLQARKTKVGEWKQIYPQNEPQQ